MAKVTPDGRMVENEILKRLAIPRAWGDRCRISLIRQECSQLSNTKRFDDALMRLRSRHLIEGAGWGMIRLVKPEPPKPPKPPKPIHKLKKHYVISVQVLLMDGDEFLDAPEVFDLPTKYETLEHVMAVTDNIVSTFSHVVFLPCGEPSYLGQE